MHCIVLLDPFRDLVSSRHAVDRLFDEIPGQPGSPFAALASPPIGLCQTADEKVVRASLPGVASRT